MPGNQLYNEKELLQRIAAGNEDAFKALFNLYRLRLFSYVYEYCHNSFDTEEIVQEIFIKIWENRTLLADVEYPGQYIYTSARNHTYNYLQKVSKNIELVRQAWLNLQNENLLPDHLLDANENRDIINEALLHLSEKKQELFRLRQQGLKYEEIAALMGLSKSTLKNMMSGILKFLQDYLSRRSLHICLILLSLHK